MATPPRPESIIGGRQALTVLKTPERLTAIISSHIASDIDTALPSDTIPALATTMSICPNSASAVSLTCAKLSESRTSPRRAITRRPVSRTRRAVSSRSARVAMGTSTVGNCSQMSKTTISAPSLASFMA